MMDASQSLRRRLRAAAAWTAGALALAAAPVAPGVVAIAELHPAAEESFDSRTASVAPTAAQLDAVERLGATARFSELGTPQSLVVHGGFLATGIEGSSAAAAARAWLEENKGLFRLSSLDGLELVRGTRLRGSDGHAVLFRQSFGSLLATPDGLLVVGVAGSPSAGWDLAYVSSRLTGDTAVEGRAELSAKEAWAAVAAAVGADVEVADIEVTGRKAGWTMLDVEGLDDPQSIRAAAFPTPKRGVLRAYETTS